MEFIPSAKFGNKYQFSKVKYMFLQRRVSERTQRIFGFIRQVSKERKGATDLTKYRWLAQSYHLRLHFVANQKSVKVLPDEENSILMESQSSSVDQA